MTLFDKIRESFEFDNGYSEAKMVKLLSEVDFLFLDVLGKRVVRLIQSGMSGRIRYCSRS